MKITTELKHNIGNFLLNCLEKYAIANFRNLSDSQIYSKNNGSDIVTQIDLDIENDLTQYLRTMISPSFVLGEESFANDKSLMAQAYHHDYVWILDPLDGTRNFSQEINCYSSLLGLACEGEVKSAWLYDCIKHDIIIAERGKGAFYMNSRQELQKKQQNLPLSLSNFVGHFSPKLAKKLENDGVKTALDEKQDLPYNDLSIKQRLSLMKNIENLRCAGVDFIQMALGQRHFSLYNNLKPWDHVAGKLLLEEMGGAFQQFDSELAYDPFAESGTFIAVFQKQELIRMKKILCLE